MNSTQELTFTASPVIVAMSVASFALIVGFAVCAWYKSGFERGTGITEMLRVVIGGALAMGLTAGIGYLSGTAVG